MFFSKRKEDFIVNRNRIFALLTAFCILMVMLPQNRAVNAEDTAADNEEFAYFMNTAGESAYVLLGENIEENGIGFLDGQAMGITDKSEVLYNETVLLDGLYARKQYSSNSAYFKVSDKFYTPGDNEFLISIVFYDFGPSEGKFYFEYHTKSGAVKQVTLVKPGTNPGWSVKTVCVDDIDLSKTYDNGATFRIVNGAYNAFKKLEMANISKAKRDKMNLPVTCLGIELCSEMESLNMIDAGDARFINKNLANQCTMYDAQQLFNLISTGNQGTVSETLKNQKLTQGELLNLFLAPLNIRKTSDEDIVETSRRFKVTDTADFLLFEESPATNYNLLSVAHAVLTYETANGEMLLGKLIKNGFYDNVSVGDVKSDAFQYIYYKQPRKLPYKTIVDNMTGRTYHYINFFGSELIKGYLTFNSWVPDGSGFVCSTRAGYMYLYDIKSQMITYLDKHTGGVEPDMTICRNGYVYYEKMVDGVTQLWRMNYKTYEKECVFIPPEGINFSTFTVTTDGKYAAYTVTDNLYLLNPPTDAEHPIVKNRPVLRVNLEDKTIDYHYYGFDLANWINHVQINPVYSDLVMFCHDAVGVAYGDIYDRVNIMDMDTGEVYSNYQGQMPNGATLQLSTHEVWAHDGEYVYYCQWSNTSDFYTGRKSTIVRMDKDGRHRQYIQFNNPRGIANHGNVSGDNKMFCVDGEWVSLLSLETEQTFPITNISLVSGSNDPYHPHPNLSYRGNMVSWSHEHDGVLGIAFMNYTDILEKEVKKGGRYPFGDDVTRISYDDLECESKVVTKYGRECATTKHGKSIYFDINPEIIDTTNGAIKITFDYYDNSTRPLIITYTRGVNEPNDIIYTFDKTINVRREGTGKWKKAEVIINSGNFENAGQFFSDFKITSGALNAFIANVKVEAIEK